MLILGCLGCWESFLVRIEIAGCSQIGPLWWQGKCWKTLALRGPDPNLWISIEPKSQQMGGKSWFILQVMGSPVLVSSGSSSFCPSRLFFMSTWSSSVFPYDFLPWTWFNHAGNLAVSLDNYIWDPSLFSTKSAIIHSCWHLGIFVTPRENDIDWNLKITRLKMNIIFPKPSLFGFNIFLGCFPPTAPNFEKRQQSGFAWFGRYATRSPGKSTVQARYTVQTRLNQQQREVGVLKRGRCWAVWVGSRIDGFELMIDRGAI